QSLKAPVQTGVQTPVTQLVVPWAFTQRFVQLPQLDRVVCRLVSHPFAGFVSQSPNPAKQVGEQVPPEQTTVPLSFWQVLPQPPQLDVLEFRLASQPLEAMPSQFAKPVLHVGVQLPAAQAVEPFGFRHVVPQVPQFPVLV